MHFFSAWTAVRTVAAALPRSDPLQVFCISCLPERPTFGCKHMLTSSHNTQHDILQRPA